jgi:hypothetical protein
MMDSNRAVRTAAESRVETSLVEARQRSRQAVAALQVLAADRVAGCVIRVIRVRSGGFGGFPQMSLCPPIDDRRLVGTGNRFSYRAEVDRRFFGPTSLLVRWRGTHVGSIGAHVYFAIRTTSGNVILGLRQ